MATDAQRARRRAQRATAAAVRDRRRQLPAHITRAAINAPIDFGQRVIDGDTDEPAPDRHNPESRQLARLASLAKYGKAPAEFLDAFESHFYHNKGEKNGNR